MYIVVDVESDGQIIGINSMVCFGAVLVEPGLTKTFYGKILRKCARILTIPNQLICVLDVEYERVTPSLYSLDIR